MFRFIDVNTGSLTATSGTHPCGSAHKANFSIVLDSNATYEVAVKPVRVNTGTCSKNSFAAVLTDNGLYEAYKPLGVQDTWWIAHRIYNASATGATGGANNRYTLELLDGSG